VPGSAAARGSVEAARFRIVIAQLRASGVLLTAHADSSPASSLILNCYEDRTLTATGRRVARDSGARTRYRGNRCFTKPKPASARLPQTAVLK